jgi:hypothetical protein
MAYDDRGPKVEDPDHEEYLSYRLLRHTCQKPLRADRFGQPFSRNQPIECSAQQISSDQLSVHGHDRFRLSPFLGWHPTEACWLLVP